MTKKPSRPSPFIQYSSLGFQILGFMAVFGYIGHNIDEYYGFKTPYITMAGLVFGVVGSMVYLIRTLNRHDE